MESCIYEGVVRHSRTEPPNAFRFALFMIYLDLAELDDVFRRRWFWSADRMNAASFNRAYHLGDPAVPLDRSVRDLVEERLGNRPRGPVRMLTQLRYFGYNFNPVSFYYCFDSGGRHVETIVVEIHNTPWGELFCYVLGEDENKGTESEKKFGLSKDFHISPFMGMDIYYDWQFTQPGDFIHVRMRSHKNGNNIFEAELSMERRKITGRELSRMLTRYPFMNMRIIGAIYWQALRLWVKGAPFYTHPAKRNHPPESPVK